MTHTRQQWVDYSLWTTGQQGSLADEWASGWGTAIDSPSNGGITPLLCGGHPVAAPHRRCAHSPAILVSWSQGPPDTPALSSQWSDATAY
ncbi:unnamed protein product [Schistocephalus solidus]|uniref:Uncharacterized protein n=1 Tax=Schistocephalus solidus TaxID=70667 RepID=A0A183SKB1_SCHSO|nr:unnamed protein product [Schistocephalus solidus]